MHVDFCHASYKMSVEAGLKHTCIFDCFSTFLEKKNSSLHPETHEI